MSRQIDHCHDDQQRNELKEHARAHQFLAEIGISPAQHVQQAQHQQHTAEIIRLETELNDRVYALFNLTPAEIKIIEDSTKYQYGEV